VNRAHIIINVLICLLLSSVVHAYNTNDTLGRIGTSGGHEELTQWSYKIASDEGYATCFDLSNLVNGAHDEDTLPNPLNHFYNPNTFSGLKIWMPSELSDGIIVPDGITFGNARDRAEWFINLANR